MLYIFILYCMLEIFLILSHVKRILSFLWKMCSIILSCYHYYYYKVSGVSGKTVACERILGCRLSPLAS